MPDTPTLTIDEPSGRSAECLKFGPVANRLLGELDQLYEDRRQAQATLDNVEADILVWRGRLEQEFGIHA